MKKKRRKITGFSIYKKPPRLVPDTTPCEEVGRSTLRTDEELRQLWQKAQALFDEALK